jgi:molybdenum cofactor cytidylyltransferase
MRFGAASPAEAIGGVTVHTLRQGSLVLKKGTTIGPAEIEALNKAGVKEIVVVRLDQGDVSEDVAAASIAQAVTGEGIHAERAFTGRANLSMKPSPLQRSPPTSRWSKARWSRPSS